MAFPLFAQSFAYTHQTIRISFRDIVQLVPEIASRHHIFLFQPDKKPVVYVYDDALKLQAKKEVPFPVKPGQDIQIFSRQKNYYLYAKSPGSRSFLFWKFDAEGNATDYTPVLQKLIGSQFSDTSSSVRILLNNDRLYLVTQVYYPALKKIVFTQVRLDSNLQFIDKRYVVCPYNKENETVKQVLIPDDNRILLLKTGVNENSETVMDLVSMDLQSGSAISTQFNCGYSSFSQPAIHYNEKDSGLLVSSIVREKPGTKIQRYIFLSRLDARFNATVPNALLRFSGIYSFLAIEGVPGWLHFVNAFSRYNRLQQGDRNGLLYDETDLPAFPLYQQSIPAEPSSPASIRFSLLDSQFNLKKENVVRNTTRFEEIISGTFGIIKWQDRDCLLLKQAITTKRTGLVIFSVDEDQKITSTPLRVYDRYQYMVEQAQQCGGKNILLPYRFKGELGLVKIKAE
jgi:hypothetical protein